MDKVYVIFLRLMLVKYNTIWGGGNYSNVQEAINELNNEKISLTLFGSYTKSSSVTTGSYPTTTKCLITVYGGEVNEFFATAFIDDRMQLKKKLRLDDTHYVYFNQYGAFDMNSLSDGSVVNVYSIV